MSTLLYPSVRGHFDSLFNSIPSDIFDSSFSPLYRSRQRQDVTASQPRANIYKKDNCYTIELAAPGYSRDEFEMNVEDGLLSISISTEDGKDNKKYMQTQEWSFASFTRSWALPETAVISAIAARYEAGILYVEIPVEKEKNSKRTINIE